MDFDILENSISYGLVPFETIYFNFSTPQFVEEHFSRLKRACKVFKVIFNMDFQEFTGQLNYFIEKSHETSGVIKLAIFNNQIHMKYRRANYKSETYKRGMKIRISKNCKDSNNILNYFKTFNFGMNYIEDIRAKEKGYDGVLFLNNMGNICETSYANIFFRKENILYTPELRNGILKGVLRNNVIKEARNMNYIINKVNIKLSDLEDFEEGFITNSVVGVFPVARIGDIEFKSFNFCHKINKNESFFRDWHK